MAITLETSEYPARVQLTGQESLTLAAGKRVKIETFPQGQELLDAEVPAGKVWKVHITISIEEEPA